MSPVRRTAIRAGHIIAFDGRGHRLLRDGVVVIEGDHILHVGSRFDGTVEETLDVRDRVLTPGLISTHAHIGGSPLDRSFMEDRGSPQFWYSGLFELLQQAKRHADERQRPYQVHASQSVVEFYEMLERHGTTPIAWLRDLGVLGPNTTLGHAIIIGGSSWTNYPPEDLQILADSGCSVAHAVWVFARRGVAMESFSRYLAAGVAMSLGTDTSPQSVIEAMRWAAVVSKIVDRNTQAVTAADVFNAATLGGARALGRDDLGRVAPGAKADLVLWKGRSWGMTPLRDPVKNIVYNATADDIDRVYVNGRLVVTGGRVLAADEAAILAALQAGGERMWPRMGTFDWAGRGADTLSPQTYPEWAS